MPAHWHRWQLSWASLIVIIIQRTLRYLMLHVNHLFLDGHRMALLNDPVLASRVPLFKHAFKSGSTCALRHLLVSIVGRRSDWRWSYRRHTWEAIIWGGANNSRLVRALSDLSHHFNTLAALWALLNRYSGRYMWLMLILYVLNNLNRLKVISVEVAILHLRIYLFYRL